MKRPRLTKKVLRGLLHVWIHANSDLEVMSADEDRDPKDLDDMGTALEYIDQLRQWGNGKTKKEKA